MSHTKPQKHKALKKFMEISGVRKPKHLNTGHSLGCGYAVLGI